MNSFKLALFFFLLAMSYSQYTISKNDSIRLELESFYFNTEIKTHFQLSKSPKAKDQFLSQKYERLPKEMNKLLDPYKAQFIKYTNYNYEIISSFGVLSLGQTTRSPNLKSGFNLRTKSFIQKELKYNKLSILFQYNYDWQEFNILGSSSNYNSINTIFSLDLNKQSN